MGGVIQATSRDRSERRYPILDALRFVLAFWVVMSHVGVFPLFAGMHASNWALQDISRLWNTSTYGIPAVIGFFIISGFCIHLPYRHDEELPVGRYYARRYIRILIPVACALVISRLAGNRQPVFGENSILWSSVLWSLACEEIYYAVYPVIRIVRRRLGWGSVLAVAFSLSVLALAAQYRASVWGDFGPWKTALVLFPVWLLGCVLAEQSERLSPVTSPATIWTWRMAIWVASWICLVLNFRGGVPYTHTMLPFGVMAYFWIKKEIAYSVHRRPSPLLVFGGAWSYSLYLLHYPALDVLAKFHPPDLGPRLNWCLSYGVILGFAYLFYVAIERPSHRMARKFGAISKAQRAPEAERLFPGAAGPMVVSVLRKGAQD